MLRKIFILISCAASVAIAQTAPKIGVINIERALAGTQEGKKATESLAAKVEPQQKQFEARQQEIVSLTDQLNKGATLLSDEKKNDLIRDMDQKKKRLERDMQDANESLQNERQKLLQGLGQRLTTVLNKYAKDNGYTLILETGDPNGEVIYAAPALDITQDVINAYDKAYPAGAAARP